MKISAIKGKKNFENQRLQVGDRTISFGMHSFLETISFGRALQGCDI